MVKKEERLITCWVILIVFISLIQMAYGQSKLVTIKGTVPGDTKGHNKIYCYGNGVQEDLSSELKDGAFEFSIPFDKPAYIFFNTEYDLKTKHGYQPFGVLIDEPGYLLIQVDSIENAFKNAKITGMPTSVLYQSFRNDEKNINSRIFQATEEKYGKGWVPSDDPLYPKIANNRDSLAKVELHPYVKKWIKDNMNSYASVFVLNQYKESLDFSALVKIYGTLKKEFQNSDHGVLISNYIEGMQNSEVGKVAKNFTLPAYENSLFSLSQLKGKYVVLDFWASWCGPCRESFPRMREVYSRLKGRNVEFINISIDKNKDSWTKAVQKEGNPWIQVWDNQDIALKFFGVSSVPTTFLIDRDGKILMKEIGFHSSGQIENKLKGLFGI